MRENIHDVSHDAKFYFKYDYAFMTALYMTGLAPAKPAARRVS
jgi:hypothetical protein